MKRLSKLCFPFLCCLLLLSACRTPGEDGKGGSLLTEEAWTDLEERAAKIWNDYKDKEAQPDLPGQPGTPAPTPAPGAADFPADITWLHPNISGWPVTAKLNAEVKGANIVLDYDKADTWPVLRMKAKDGGDLVGNCWAVFEYEGRMVAAAWDWMRKGQRSKATSSLKAAEGHIPGIASSWLPRSGQRIGFMVSTAARGAERSANERSNLVWTVMP